MVRMKDDTDHFWNVTQNKGVLILNNCDLDHAITTENSVRYMAPLNYDRNSPN